MGQVKTKGCVYILEAEDCIKIGRTTNPKIRIQTIKTTSGRNFKRIFHTVHCNNYCNIENEMHKIFKAKRITGEWFNVEFDEAKKALEKFDLDLKEIIKEDKNPSDILKAFHNQYMRNEVIKFLDERPIFKKYLSKNNIQIYYTTEDGFMVTDNKELDMPLKLFNAIYKESLKGNFTTENMPE